MNERIMSQEMVELFADYLRREEKSTATCEKYLRDVGCFLRFVGAKSVTKDMVVAWKRNL